LKLFGVKLGFYYSRPRLKCVWMFGGAKPPGVVLEDCVGWRKPNLLQLLVPTGNSSWSFVSPKLCLVLPRDC